jgi:hypothetical protein
MFKACAICGKAEPQWRDPAVSAGRLAYVRLGAFEQKIGAANQAGDAGLTA